MRVPLYLAEQHIAFETLVHPPAFTAQKRAKYLAVSGRQVAKSVLLSGPEGYFLAVLPATEHIDTDALARHCGGPVRLAGDRELAEVFRDCEWGAVPPFGALYGLPTVMEETFAPDSILIFEGHSHAEAIRLHSRDFVRLERPRRLRFTRAWSASAGSLKAPGPTS
jgi:Ala-tRNA(Pro) deacylase